MQYSKTDSQSNSNSRTKESSEQTRRASASETITELPHESPPRLPKDLPSPRHRPGEPILYDPPVSGVEVFPANFPEWNREQHLP